MALKRFDRVDVRSAQLAASDDAHDDVRAAQYSSTQVGSRVSGRVGSSGVVALCAGRSPPRSGVCGADRPRTHAHKNVGRLSPTPGGWSVLLRRRAGTACVRERQASPQRPFDLRFGARKCDQNFRGCRGKSRRSGGRGDGCPRMHPTTLDAPTWTDIGRDECGLFVVCAWCEAAHAPRFSPLTRTFSGREGGIRTRGLSVPNAAR